MSGDDTDGSPSFLFEHTPLACDDDDDDDDNDSAWASSPSIDATFEDKGINDDDDCWFKI